MRRPLLVLVAGLVCGVVAVAPAAGVPEQTPERGGTVVLGVGREVPCVNPVAKTCLDSGAGLGPAFLEKVLEPAFAFSADSTLRPQLVTARHDVHEGAAIHCDLRNPSRCALERRSSRHRSGLQVHPRRDRAASPTRVAGHASSRSISAGRRREDREGRPASANRRLAHPLLPRASEACAQGPGPRRYLARRDRRSRTGAPIGNGPFLLAELGTREADDLRSEPALLGTAHRLPRPDRPPLLRNPARCYLPPPRCSRVSGRAISTWRSRVSLRSSRVCGAFRG